MRGFRSYARSHTFEFDGRRLVGVVGPIGSGKSSLLDAVAFALYGKTPTVARDTRSLVNQRAAAAHVELWFEADGQVWRAVRALRRQGQSEHALYRHAAADPDSERLEEVLGADAATRRVEEVLGLDFAAFRRSVLLAQNQFANFLRATPGDRDAVLKGVFGFDTVEAMQLAAKGRRDAAARDLEELERIRKEIEDDRARLEAVTSTHGEAVERAAVLGEAEAAFEEAATAIAAADAAEQSARVRRRELEELETRLPDRKATADLVDAARGAGSRLEAARAAAQQASAAAAAAEAAHRDISAGLGGREALAEARLAVERLADRSADVARADAAAATAAQARDETAATAARAAEHAAAAEATHRKVVETRDAAREARRAAEADLHEARHADSAAELRATLAAGEPCPVCRQPVATLPKAGRRPGLATKQKAVDKAARAEERAEQELTAAIEGAAAAGRDLAAARERAASAEQAMSAAAARVQEVAAARAEAAAAAADRLGAGDPGELLAAAEARLAAAEEEATRARAVLAEAASAVEEARAGADEAREGVQRLATELAALAARIGVDVQVAAAPDAVAAGLDDVRRAWEEAVAAADDEIRAVQEQRGEVAAARGKLLEGLGLRADADFAEALQEARAAVASLAGQIELLEQRVARFAELEKQNAALVAKLATYRVLAEDLAPSKFLKYLLDEERVGLADLGSERFELLSGGRYRFTAGFDVVDLAAADAERRADSLSGGETFLASLALALALAEMVTRRGGRLDAFFLDEGFGSLDSEHLDLAMEGIERLVADSPDRLVVLVSHVPEMRHRIEDLIVLDKEPATGNTIVLES